MPLSPYASGEPVSLGPVAWRREAAALRAEARRQFAAAREAGQPWSAEVVAATQAALADIDAEAQASAQQRRISNWRQRQQHDSDYRAACDRRQREMAVAAGRAA